MVFGQVLSGTDIVRKIEQLPSDSRSRPDVDVRVVNCGELVLLKKGKGEWAAFVFSILGIVFLTP